MTPRDEKESVEVSMSRMRLVLRILTTMSMGILVSMNLFAWRVVPKFKEIFESMVGSADQLPGLTEMIVAMSDFALPVIFTTILVPLAVVIWVWRATPPIKAACVALVVLGFLFLQWISIICALLLPLMKITQGLQ